ncbi:MAG: HutD family protein [Pikeienuella sp.]
MNIIRFADLTEVPWKNGGGITRNIAEDRRGDDLHWRLSMADVDSDGPFSDFAGLTRVLTVIKGDGMILTGPEGDIVADYALPVVFDGATPITSTLKNDPLRDLNLMFDPARCDGAVTTLNGSFRKDVPADGTIGIHCLSGAVSVNGEALLVGDTALSREDVGVEVGADGIALLISLRDISRP